MGEKEWKKSMGYGERWKIECTDSDFKRLYRSYMTERKREYMAQETYWRVTCHNLYKNGLIVLRGVR